jgi:hypothetical protein
MHAAVNGMSQYTFGWNDGTPVGSSSQKQFYSGWCVTITDLMTGCDTTICESCISTGGSGICLMIYDPVCGCDGTIYSNDCIAMQNGIFTFTSAIGPNGQLLPCIQPSTCEVEILGDSIICSLSSPPILTASINSTSGPYFYQWYQNTLSMFTAIVGANANTYTPVTSLLGTYSYCVSVTDATGCIDTACIDVSVEDIPIYSAPSPPIICLGDSIVLEIDTIGLSNIVWVPNTLLTPPVHRIVDFPIYSQTYVVEAIDASGCDRRGEILVQVDSCNNGPCTVEINNGTVDIEICDGDTVILEATTGFDTYIWTEPFSGASLGANQFIIFSPPVVGVYTIIVIATDSTNCVDMDTIEVIVNPETPLNPITAPDPPIICLGDSVVIEVNLGFVNYWWNTNNPLDQNQDRVVVFPIQDFTYVVEALDINGCDSREEIQVYVDTCTTSIINLLSAQVNIYPNPSNAEITIRLTDLETFDLEIYDVLGNQVYFEENVFNKKVISKSILSSGTYLIKIKSQEDAYFGKLVFY